METIPRQSAVDPNCLTGFMLILPMVPASRCHGAVSKDFCSARRTLASSKCGFRTTNFWKPHCLNANLGYKTRHEANTNLRRPISLHGGPKQTPYWDLQASTDPSHVSVSLYPDDLYTHISIHAEMYIHIYMCILGKYIHAYVGVCICRYLSRMLTVRLA